MHIECPVCGAFFDEDTNPHCPRCQIPVDLFSGCGSCSGCGKSGSSGGSDSGCCSSGCCHTKAESV